ncbi:ATP-binding protein [Actibacterium sp. MT2.3-13A]|uniref:ATP-binding protein n=1 Tax=Actibacterium sp. MT2.3-13A TaxID=2828332 RepID=UPI001BAC8E1C|nr:ATP-binding protein [Actibacterium sp. MT2.3-13A]
MTAPRSLQLRLALGIGLVVTLLWIAAATVTSALLRHEMDEVFDSALQETAQRILPLAVLDILGRDEAAVAQRIATLREHEELFTYIVRDAQGRVLLHSHAADETIFPPYAGTGFRQTATHRLYYDAALRESLTIAVAEPLSHRAAVAGEMRLGLGLPLLVVIPLSLIGILAAVRLSFRPLRRLRDDLGARHARDLSPVPGDGLPTEVAPVVGALNQLFERLDAAFEAERSFAANAAHELRTPIAGAIAQAQRLRAEVADPQAAQRAADIETSLKRLTRLSEKLMQLARAEGSRLRTGNPADLRPVLRIVAADFERSDPAGRLALAMPDAPVLSDIDPDAFGILCRNLIENALKHGAPDRPVAIRLSGDGTLSVANEGPVVPPETLDRLLLRFERGADAGDGTGLGLAIARTIAERAEGTLTLRSPPAGRETGFEAVVTLPPAG